MNIPWDSSGKLYSTMGRNTATSAQRAVSQHPTPTQISNDVSKRERERVCVCVCIYQGTEDVKCSLSVRIV